MDQIFTSIGEIPYKEEDSDSSSLPDPQSKPGKVKTSQNAFQSHTAPDETLDLHGKNRQEALMLVENYIHYGALHGLNSLLIEVTPLLLIPQGIIPSKYDKSVLTFNAKPCIVTHLLTFIPIAHIFLSFLDPISNQTPVSFGFPNATIPK
mgnify:CR=1 FL=1